MKKKDRPDIYFCDPRKNTKCTKEGCAWKRNGLGLCFATKDKSCAFDNMPDPLIEHRYNSLDDNAIWPTIWNSEVGKDIQKKCFEKEDSNECS